MIHKIRKRTKLLALLRSLGIGSILGFACVGVLTTGALFLGIYKGNITFATNGVLLFLAIFAMPTLIIGIMSYSDEINFMETYGE